MSQVAQVRQKARKYAVAGGHLLERFHLKVTPTGMVYTSRCRRCQIEVEVEFNIKHNQACWKITSNVCGNCVKL